MARWHLPHFVEKARRGMLTLLLSGTMLTTGAFGGSPKPGTGTAPPADTTTAVTPLDSLAVQREQTRSGDKYTWRQAEIRAMAARNGQFHYEARENPDSLKAMFARSAQTDYSYEQVPEGVRDLWQNMQTLRNSHSIMGPALADFSVRANIFYDYTPMTNTDGLWHNSNGVADIGSSDHQSQAHRLLTQVHETIHGIQEVTEGHKDYFFSLADFQLSQFSGEAAAMAGGHIIALDLARTGITDPWRSFEQEPRSESRAIEAAYDSVMKGGGTRSEALAAAGIESFKAQFKDQSWLDFYNDQVLANYIPRLTQADFPFEHYGRTHYGLEEARKTGWISPEFNFTAKLDTLPVYADRFGDNKKMRQVFDYVELQCLLRCAGEQDPTYLEKLDHLRQDKNPYLGLDLKQVQQERDRPGNQRGVFDIMNDLAKAQHHHVPGHKKPHRPPAAPL
ncbi:MAG: hypothetical protein HY052_02380 [Proteobacteria bacterium]|nr:hypothetical protein [Pseudomonadota bacterium]